MNKIPALLAMIALSIGFTARADAADAAPTTAPATPMLGAVGIGVKDLAVVDPFLQRRPRHEGAAAISNSAI